MLQFLLSVLLLLPGQLVETKENVRVKKAILVGVENTIAETSNESRYDPTATANTSSNVETLRDILEEADYDDIEIMEDYQALHDDVARKLRLMARSLKAGDVFTFYFTGHGESLKNFAFYDFNRSEQDGTDEGIVLYDEIMIDDTIHALLSEFQAGVQIFMMMDCCHAGSMYALSPKDFYFAPNFDNPFSIYLLDEQDCSSDIKYEIENISADVLYFGAGSDSDLIEKPLIADMLYDMYAPRQYASEGDFCQLIESYSEEYNDRKISIAATRTVDNDFLTNTAFFAH
ncbi:MAG: caspase family protein [Bacteroidota bacterium]